MPLPDSGLYLFKKSPLKLVMGQVRFPVLPRFGDPSFIGRFHEMIRKDYPKQDREQQMGFQWSPKGGMQPIAGETLWRFATRDGRWSVVLAETAVTLESRAYTSFDDFFSRFRLVLQAACKSLEITDRLRLGLRYVNEIRHPDGEDFSGWVRLMSPSLLGFSAQGIVDGRLEHMIQELRWQMADGVLAMRHGMLAGTAVEPRPGETPALGKFYLVDLDYYDPTECELDLEATVQQIRAYNSLAYKLFRWTLSQELFEYLEPVPCPQK